MQVKQIEQHRAGRTGWLRAAVLGANDGLLSTASLVMGVAAAHGSRNNVLIAGFAALVFQRTTRLTTSPSAPS